MDTLSALSNRDSLAGNVVKGALFTSLIVFVAATLGIHTRVYFELASLWPANAVMLGILAIKPRNNNLPTWILCAVAFMAADLISGADLMMAAMLNGANLIGIATGVALIELWARRFFPIEQPTGVILLYTVILGASVGCGVTGAFIGGPLFGMSWQDAFFLWMATDFVNYAIFLPMVVGPYIFARETFREKPNWTERSLAVASLIASCCMMIPVGGAGALALYVPALIWCSILFPPLLSFALSATAATWTLIAVPLGIVALHPSELDLTAWQTASFRIGVGMITLGALAVALFNSFWRRAHGELQYRANHDHLTGLLNRAQFSLSAETAIANQRPGVVSIALAIDIDHFKSINDTYGHPIGDKVLQQVSQELAAGLRRGDVIGRVGGEEFMIVLPNLDLARGLVVAERIRDKVATQPVPHLGTTISTSISIGLVEFTSPTNLPRMLSLADEALYEAKGSGRNRVVTYDRAASAKALTT
jgi:diguanylate cyclase (GGDEF)-like protein